MKRRRWKKNRIEFLWFKVYRRLERTSLPTSFSSSYYFQYICLGRFAEALTYFQLFIPPRICRYNVPWPTGTWCQHPQWCEVQLDFRAQRLQTATWRWANKMADFFHHFWWTPPGCHIKRVWFRIAQIEPAEKKKEIKRNLSDHGKQGKETGRLTRLTSNMLNFVSWKENHAEMPRKNKKVKLRV